MSVDERKRELLREILSAVRQTGRYPTMQPFRVAHEDDRKAIDEMVQERLLRTETDHYVLTLDGLRACGGDEAREEVKAAAELLDTLRNAYRRNPSAHVSSPDLADALGKPVPEIQRALTILSELPIWSSSIRDSVTGLVKQVSLTEDVLDVSAIDLIPAEEEEEEPVATQKGGRLLTKIEVNGYRPFRTFFAEPGDLTVIIGANATGKSSLFDFLRFISRAVEDPLPPEIDERSAGKMLFHVGGPERIAFAITLDLGQRLPVRYEVEILGPVGNPRVARERLATTRPLHNDAQQPFLFLDFTVGKGVVRDQRGKRLIRPEWTVKANELALRRTLDPTLITLSRVQGLLSSWRFYSGFDVSSAAAVRRPVPTEPEPILREDGSNLSAVLIWLNHEHQQAWEELESHVRSAIPGFRSLNVKPRGGPGTVIGVWREDGVDGDLTLADLSDGTLRLLCWAVLCLSPNLPPLLCIDEPELGLHPRVLPMLAGLLRLASGRTQILVATHSPYFLAQFALDEIAVMRKREGAAEFVRPACSRALRTMVEELGGEALTRLHLSDELETLP